MKYAELFVFVIVLLWLVSFFVSIRTEMYLFLSAAGLIFITRLFRETLLKV
jgi:hypothetical protein